MAYTSIDDSSEHFQSNIFTTSGGSGSTTFGGNSNLQPDFLWVKQRNAGNSNELWDSSRGVNSTMFSGVTEAEDTATGRLSSFDTDGFSWGTSGNLNTAGNFVSWAWKVNGGTTSTNTDGSANSTVQANTTAGISVVTFTANGSTEAYGHGLGVKPDVVIVKSRNVAGGWLYITDVIDGTLDYGRIDQDGTFSALSYNLPTSSVFSYNDNNTNTQVAYCFASKQGFSKFGKYRGTGNLNGAFNYTGFKPAFVLLKQTSGSGNGWFMFDTARNPFNRSTSNYLRADESGAEGTTSKIIDMYSNGFKLIHADSGTNGYNHTYTYMAFAENPFVTSGGTPTTAL